MTRAYIGGTILLLSSLLAAQSPSQAPGSPAIQAASTSLPVTVSITSCPVALHALQGSGSGLLAVRNTEPIPGPAQHIRLILIPTTGNASRPVSGRVTVHGLSGKNRTLLPTQLSNAERFDKTRTLNVTFTPQENKEVATELTLSGFTSVSSIRLESLDYADGSTWKVANGLACQVAPDPMMLIAGP